MAMATNSPRIFGFKVIVVISCVYIVLGFPSPAASNSLPSSQLSQSSSGSAGNGAGSKKIHLVSPTMNKMYRLMKYGVSSLKNVMSDKQTPKGAFSFIALHDFNNRSTIIFSM